MVSSNSYGPCLVIVAVNNEEEIVGKIAFIPAVINLNGREIKASAAQRRS
jgi:hypothetical protein